MRVGAVQFMRADDRELQALMAARFREKYRLIDAQEAQEEKDRRAEREARLQALWDAEAGKALRDDLERELAAMVWPVPKVKRKRDRKPSSKDVERTPEWKALRHVAFERYGRVCAKCGAKDELHVDHVIPKYRRPDLALDLGNLQILCRRCNFAKGFHSQDDYRSRSPAISAP